MAGEWRKATLDQLGRIVTGKTPPSRDSGYYGGEIPFVTPTDFDGRRVIASTGRYLTEQGADAVSGSRIPRRAVMVSCIGSDMGKAAVAGRECVTNQQINSVVVESGDDPMFVYYNLSTRKAEIRGAAGGSAQPILNKSAFGRLDILLPLPDEQRAIAHILGTLDDKIELNRRMNETLEAMARALFKSWFVDFDPIRAKANLPSPAGRGAGGEGPPCSSHAYPPTELRDFARALRNNQTDAEHLMWRMLRDRRIAGAKFRRQHPVPPYVLDFYCHELKLAIELDGGQHGEPTGLDRDRQRDAALSERGITVLRFWNHEVLNETEAVLEQTYQAVTERVSPSPQTPLPTGEGFYDLPKPLADLFPDSFEDSELGEIPKGWEVGRFGDVVEQLRDQENPLSFPNALFHHFSIPAFDEGQSPKSEYGESIKSLKSRVPAGAILLSKLNPEIERVWMVDVRPDERAVCSTEFLVLRARPPFTRSYVYCLARSPLFRQQIEGLVTGTSKSHQRAQVDSILNLPVVAPPSSIVAAFERSADGLLARTLECRRESRTLAAVRDALLPKLISGALQVQAMREDDAHV